MSGAGNYGAASSQLLSGDQAALTPAQVRMQNLKATRRMSPVARAVVGSFAAAGGTDEETFKFHGEKKAPGAEPRSGTYSMR